MPAVGDRSGSRRPAHSPAAIAAYLNLIFSTTKNAAKTPQINKRNRLPLSALRCHRDRLSTAILAPFLAVVSFEDSKAGKKARLTSPTKVPSDSPG